MTAAGVLALSIAELAQQYRTGGLSPVEVTQACLDRIAAVDGRLQAFITLTADRALAQARTAQDELAHGVDRGPLQGVPFALKDLYATKGIRTTAHSKVLLDWVPDADAFVTGRLYAAGIALLGKLAMHEFAFGFSGVDTPFPPARNPWNTECVTGGSSSGSGAALAGLECYGSLGSDTGGSIRNPAHLCGIVGLKPTYGLVSRAGVVPLSWSLDHCGPMARTVEDCAIILQAIAGHDPQDPASANVAASDYRAALGGSLRGLRAAIPRSWFGEGEGTDPEVLAAFDAAVAVLVDAGVQVHEVDGADFEAARYPNMTILSAEAYSYHEVTIRERPQDYSAGVRNRIREGAFLSAADYLAAQRARTGFIRRIQAVFDGADLVLSPAGPRTAATFEATLADPGMANRTPSYTNAFNLTGLPAISVPCGLSRAGLPIGLQIAGRAFAEATVLRAAHVYQRATAWHTQHPDLGV